MYGLFNQGIIPAVDSIKTLIAFKGFEHTYNHSEDI